MKRLPGLLAVSLVTNLLLAAAWWTSSSPAPKTTDAVDPATAALAAVPPVPTTHDVPQSWGTLTAGIGDDPTADALLVERLRAAHFDDEAIRSILTRRIKARYVDRELAVLARHPRPEYWSNSFYITLRGPLEQRAELRRLRVEQNSQLDALLGARAESPEDRRARERRFGPLPRETADKLKDLLADYRDLAAEARAEMQGFSLPSDREDLALIEEARINDLAALLTPEQLEAYLLRSGPVGSRLRQTLTEFAPTEDEFLKLYALQNAFDDQWGSSSSGLSREQRQARTAAQQELNTQIAAALGPERYADYEVLALPQYRFVKQLTDRLNLPVENARAVTQLQQDTNARFRALMTDRNLSVEARTAQQGVLQQQVREQLSALLTADGLSAYEGSGVGGWVKGLVPTNRNPNGGG